MINQFQEMLEGITDLMIPTITDDNYCEILGNENDSFFKIFDKFFNPLKN